MKLTKIIIIALIVSNLILATELVRTHQRATERYQRIVAVDDAMLHLDGQIIERYQQKYLHGIDRDLESVLADNRAIESYFIKLTELIKQRELNLLTK